jgi:prepilin-type N-terminal cleavage/methylation domain-containing protein
MSRRGFTLVELSLVIVLTLILTSVVIHGLRGIGSWRAAAAIGRVQADVLYARDQALLSGRRTLCVFDATSQTYEIKQEAAPASGSISATTSPGSFRSRTCRGTFASARRQRRHSASVPTGCCSRHPGRRPAATST